MTILKAESKIKKGIIRLNGSNNNDPNPSEPIILYRSENIANAFTIIRGNIQNNEGEKAIKTICVTSSIRGEGSSTIALNFAASAAEADNQRILLLDANLRHPSLHKVFGIDNSDGLSDILFGNAQPEDVVKNTGITNLQLVPAGELQINLNRVFSRTAIKRALNSFGEKYDLIVLDSPPVTKFSDASTISGAVDGMILVVAAHRTRSEVISEALKQLNNSGAHILGSILNKREYIIPNSFYKRLK